MNHTTLRNNNTREREEGNKLDWNSRGMVEQVSICQFNCKINSLITLPKNPRKVLEECSKKKELRMNENSLKTKLIHTVWANAWLAVHVVLGWNARVYKRARPAVHFYRELSIFNTRSCTICMTSHALMQVLSTSARLCTYTRSAVHNLEVSLPCSFSHELLKSPLFLQFIPRTFLSMKTRWFLLKVRQNALWVKSKSKNDKLTLCI